MQLTQQTLTELLDFHYGKRELVYDFLATLPAEAFVKPMSVGWSNMRTTLVHCLLAEEYWVQHGLRHLPHLDVAFTDYPDVASVRQLAAEVRQRTEAYLATLAESDLDRPEELRYSSGAKVEFTAAKALMHVMLHDAHHRGQVLALARQMGYEPPEIDLM
ncbi:MAG: hypothetical protein K0R39_4881 [Symbiobacteriaceae bacterium]|jgi:uncharacterized damage-inducible protein DinB|nr:hypothetical protein [Symbiobacteriaceae bacterium]